MVLVNFGGLSYKSLQSKSDDWQWLIRLNYWLSTWAKTAPVEQSETHEIFFVRRKKLLVFGWWRLKYKWAGYVWHRYLPSVPRSFLEAFCPVNFVDFFLIFCTISSRFLWIFYWKWCKRCEMMKIKVQVGWLCMAPPHALSAKAWQH